MGLGVENLSSDLTSRFDVITASGVFLLKHMPKEAIDDCHAMLKMGGYIVTAMRSNLWVDGNEAGYKDQFEALF